MTPQRIQRRRSKDWSAPAGAVYVGRPTVWGNPFTHLQRQTTAAIIVPTRESAVAHYRAMIEDTLTYDVTDPATHAQMQYVNSRGAWIRSHLHSLAGKDLICWCGLHETCHADVLLEKANS